MYSRLITLSFLILALVNWCPAPAGAQSGLATPAGLEGIRLIEGWRDADGTYIAAIEIRLAPGWHTYWRTPGKAGIPPEFDWSGSANLAEVRYVWPTPLVFDTYGIPTIGYEGALVLPVLLRPEDPDAAVDVRLDLFLGVCDEICVPAGAHLSARLEPGTAAHGRAAIETALARRARSPTEADVTDVACRIEPDSDGFVLTAEITFARPPGPDQVAVLESGDPDLWIGMPQSATTGRHVVARARVEPIAGGAWIDRKRLRITVLDARRAVDIRGCPAG